MWSLIKLAVAALSIYAVLTASPSDQMAMAQGARAFTRALWEACTRPGSPCEIATKRVSELGEPTNPGSNRRKTSDR